MTRISENQVQRRLLANIVANRSEVNKYGDEVSTGLKVQDPGDSPIAGTVSQFKETLSRIEGYKTRVTSATSALTFQDDLLVEVSDLLMRAKEVATQGANETNGAESRIALANEIYQLRDQLANLANSTYQGKFIYSGGQDDVAPYSASNNFFNQPATAGAPSRVHYSFIGTLSAGDALQCAIPKNVSINDELNLQANTPATNGGTRQIFDRAMEGLERLGRALGGYRTDPPLGEPVVSATPLATGGAAYTTLPNPLEAQTYDIKRAMDLLDQAREEDILPERVNIGARIKRLQTADSLLDVNKQSAQTVIDSVQNADIVEAASNLSIAQTALQASLQVSVQLLNQTILDFI